MADLSRIKHLITLYWSLAYAEGKEGRNHDTEAGDAADCWHAIQAELSSLTRTQPSPVTSVEVPRLSEAEIESICRVGAVYAPDGMVTRHPIEYRRELEANARSAVRKAQAELIAKMGGKT